MNRLIVSALMIGSAIPSAFSAPTGMRLVETAPGVQSWMRPEQLEALSEKAHHEGKCGGFMDITDYPISLAAPKTRVLELDGREPQQQATVEPLLRKVDPGNLLAVVTQLSSFENRDYNTDIGVEAAKHIQSRYQAIAGGRSDIRVELVAHTRFKQPSVIATIPGTGPNKDEIVVVGGHIDSISRGSKAPGADDNASGTATVMETFRILVESGFQPNRTLQFMGYAGEERGLLGSQAIATSYRNTGAPVVGALQFDMTMYPTATPRVAFVTDHVNRDLTKFIQRLADEYVKVRWIETRCGYACSDHASWNRAGYPAAFPFETDFNEYNQDIHTPKDTVANLDPNHGAHYVKLGVAFAVELAQAQDSRNDEPTPPAPAPQPNPPSDTQGSSWPSLTRL